jgi:hypothetical protein
LDILSDPSFDLSLKSICPSVDLTMTLKIAAVRRLASTVASAAHHHQRPKSSTLASVVNKAGFGASSAAPTPASSSSYAQYRTIHAATALSTVQPVSCSYSSSILYKLGAIEVVAENQDDDGG